MAERARRALGVGHGRLVSASGGVLDGDTQLAAAELQTGDCLTLHVGPVRVCCGNKCFAAILGDGTVVTWGDRQSGGSSSSVQHQLKNVQQIQASEGAFAAILGDGSVVTWGNAHYGGDSTSVQDRLENVQQIQASNRAFAAILGDGSVVTWGNARIRDGLKNVQQIQGSKASFAAILGDGSVVLWGDKYGDGS